MQDTAVSRKQSLVVNLCGLYMRRGMKYQVQAFCCELQENEKKKIVTRC